MDDFAKDFGTLMYGKIGPDREFVFYPFRMFHLVVMSEGSYTTTSNKEWEGEEYAVSLDFDQRILNQWLRTLPNRISVALQDAIENQATNFTKIDFPTPLDINVKTKLGKPQRNQYEEFIPFVATEVLPDFDISVEFEGLVFKI